MPRVIGHRGAPHSCPENTLSAFDQALAEGADGLELDLQLTSDGVPVVFHDLTLSKLGLKHKRIGQMTRADLKPLDAGAWFGDAFRGEPLPLLGQVLARYAGRTELCLEFKATPGQARAEHHDELVRQTVGLVRENGMQDQVYLLCFNSDVLKLAHKLAPEIRKVLNAISPEQALESAAGMPWLFAIDVDIRRLQPKDGAALRARKRMLMSYTCDTEAHLRAALAAGVQYVICNRPAWAREWLQRSTGK